MSKKYAAESQAEVDGARHRSVSALMAARFARRAGWRRFISSLYVLGMLAYLGWRYTIINDDSLTLSWFYFLAECFGYFLGLNLVLTAGSYKHNVAPPAEKNLSVDIFVPTYKEPIGIIRRTLMAARDVHYSHKTFVLDDGRRADVKALAQELGIIYLSRLENLHAKAGNLNFGLAHSTADFVLVFDADHIALPHALDGTLGFFRDDNVAMVQTPQEYYNTDAFQYINAKNGGLWHDQSFFFNIALPCRDAMDGVSCVGTGVVYRRAALDAINGFPVETVTEDVHTSLRFHKKGMRVVYVNEPIAYGIASSDYEDFSKTRQRWAHGNLDVLVRENIFFCRGLTLKQRFSYLTLGVIWLEGWQQLLLFVIPMVALATGLAPFEITVFNTLVILLFPLVTYTLLQEIGCGFSRFLPNEIFSMARWPIYIRATRGIFGGKLKWRSSSKSIQGHINWRLMWPQFAVAAASVGALVVAGFKLAAHEFEVGPLLKIFIAGLMSATGGDSSGASLAAVDFFAPLKDGYTVDLVLIAGAWAFYNIVRVGLFTKKVIHDARNTHAFYRFAVPLPVTLGGGARHFGVTRRVSEDWLELHDYRPLCGYRRGDYVDIILHLPRGEIVCRLKLEKIEQARGAGFILSGHIDWQSDVLMRDQLAAALYSVEWHREFLTRAAYFNTPSDNILALIGCLSKTPAAKGPWQGMVYGRDEQFAVVSAVDGEVISLIAFERFESGHVLSDVRVFGKQYLKASLEIIALEPLGSLAKEGLDKSTPYRYRINMHVAEEQQLGLYDGNRGQIAVASAQRRV